MFRRDRLLRKMTRRRYLVTTTAGEAFAGVLVDHDDGHLVLADAESIDSKDQRVAVAGQMWIPRPAVAYMQLIAP